MSVAIDTMVLIWSFPRPGAPPPNPDDAEKRTRARILMHILDEQQETIVVPTMSAAELMTPLNEEQRDRFLAALANRFECPPFDLPAAAIAADIISRHSRSSKKDRYTSRQLLRSDAVIIASAKAAGATIFYSHDDKARKLASLVMVAEDLPTRHPDMFVDQDIRSGEI